MSKKNFRVTHTEPTKAAAAAVWALWADVNNWPVWDEGLEFCKLQGPLAVGGGFILKPRGADNEIRAEFTNVAPNRGFTDETKLPFGVLRAIHSFEVGVDGNSVTHTIEAEVDDEHSDFFAKVIWPGMDKGLPLSVRNIVRLAEANA
jgi:hypothetical protein